MQHFPLLPRRRPDDGLIDWSQNSLCVYNFIRALTHPYPGAFSYVGGERIIIWRSSLMPSENKNSAFGTFGGFVYSDTEQAIGILTNCGFGQLILHEIQTQTGEIYTGKSLIAWAQTNNLRLSEKEITHAETSIGYCCSPDDELLELVEH